MNWGTGPALGPLTFVGYFLFAIGAALVWRNRDNFSIWVHAEISLFRRNFSRYTTIGPFYSAREESPFKAIPATFIRSLARPTRSPITAGAAVLLDRLPLFVV